MNMKKTLLTLLTLFALCATTTAARNTDYEGPRPAPHQLKWHEADLGVVPLRPARIRRTGVRTG